MSFASKVVIVTGASSGIGAATAVLFAKEGADVVIVGRNEVKLATVAEECTCNGKAPLVIKADMSNDDDVKKIIDETIDNYGKLDILVNNAGMGAFGGILSDTAVSTYDKVMAVNMRAVVHLTALAAPHIVETKGNIVNVSSIAGKKVLTGSFLSYSLSKATLDHFTRCIALELAPSGVRANTVSPGPVKTDFMDNAGVPGVNWDEMGAIVALKRYSESEEIAEMILYLASDKAKGITGSDFITDNGGLLRYDVPQY
ncbi:uncharacterized oxidoreductase YxbG-like [Achroia grisella]|uniref:uncharacterized oxidoreductase YxbG-like n=1 Tax=Achroia grisella TaxID=688607 RepID=UPI0027D30289|nr:uncharacterized oxidoreductase YxbG-like [Achroia grisella]